MKILSHSHENTIEIAMNLAKTLKGGSVVLLSGDLGAGKTVFAKGIAKGLGILEQITSPTFTLMNEYESSPSLCHIDAYRLKSGEEALNAGLGEYIGSQQYITVIEWHENIRSIIGKDAIKVTITKTSPHEEAQNEREIEIHD